ncbi:MAG: hypothetical protein WA902_14080 [Thermosynechococcaceae cyanobacterium]
MKNQKSSALACRHCRHFHHEGRRGGSCERLNVHVRGDWKPCPLMIPSFATPWQELENILPLDIERPDPVLPNPAPASPVNAPVKILA